MDSYEIATTDVRDAWLLRVDRAVVASMCAGLL